MNKSNYFSGQPLVSQLIKFLDREEINRTAKKEGSDRYYKKFHTYDHRIRPTNYIFDFSIICL
ncbi:DUF4372 domain-containing protein [Olivibacter sp. SDN3]|uniref:DUF4372 domain-containing protein n=1 Tax=Olivibacter sp. SDN3 TaxID=2764720 RepID=UPI00210276D5|nr:DUF4372 domain-containing protein [Olivibacter sp. SDN3]